MTQRLRPGGITFDELFTVPREAADILAVLSSRRSEILSRINAIEAVAADASNNQPKYDPADRSEPMPDLWKAIEPVFRLHDDIQKWLMQNEDLFKIDIPGLSAAVKKIGQYMDVLVYKFLAVFLEPFLQEVRNSVKAARDQVQDAGKHLHSDVWGDNSTDSNPSHSDIAKDHFSNVLNQPAGLVATVITNWTTRMVVRCWDEPDQDADDMINHILTILHHPAFMQEKNDPQKYMFLAVETWWTKHSEEQRNELREKLSKDSVKDYYDHHDHTIQASDFQGEGKECYPDGFVFPGSHPKPGKAPSGSLLGKTAELIVNVSNQLNAAGQAVVDGTLEVVNVVGDVANDAADAVSDGFNTVGRGIEDGADAVGGAIVDGVDAVGGAFAEAGNAVSNVLRWDW